MFQVRPFLLLLLFSVSKKACSIATKCPRKLVPIASSSSFTTSTTTFASTSRTSPDPLPRHILNASSFHHHGRPSLPPPPLPSSSSITTTTTTFTTPHERLPYGSPSDGFSTTMSRPIASSCAITTTTTTFASTPRTSPLLACTATSRPQCQLLPSLWTTVTASSSSRITTTTTAFTSTSRTSCVWQTMDSVPPRHVPSPAPVPSPRRPRLLPAPQERLLYCHVTSSTPSFHRRG